MLLKQVLLLNLLVLALLLSGCSDSAGVATLRDYQQRLNRVLELDSAKPQLPAAAALPAKSALQQPLPDLRIDLLDAFATRRCGLDQLIAERNSSLGKVFTASKRLHYELRFLATLELCLTEAWDEPLKSQLSQVYQQKQQTIGIALSNMLQTDDTLRKTWLGSNKALTPGSDNGFTASLGALQQLLELKQAIDREDWYSASRIDPEAALASLYRSDFFPQLQFSLRYANSWFNAVNPQLLSLAPASLCPRGQSEQLTILTTVFRKYFIGEVQAYLAKLNRYQQQSWPLIAELYQDSPLLPVLQQRYQQPATELQQQLLQHVGWYQQLNQLCPVGLTG
ncbi:MAG: DUF3080 family protein [Alishewanella aestuarii]